MGCTQVQVAREGTKKTVFTNFMELCKSMNRNHEHVQAYLLAELGTSGGVTSSLLSSGADRCLLLLLCWWMGCAPGLGVALQGQTRASPGCMARLAQRAAGTPWPCHALSEWLACHSHARLGPYIVPSRVPCIVPFIVLMALLTQVAEAQQGTTRIES